jgi:hypothetical protein
MPNTEEKDTDGDYLHDEEEQEEDLGYYGHIMKKTEKELTEEEKLAIEEEDRQNVLSVAFKAASVKEIISPHSFSILADQEPQVELAEPVLAKARQIFYSAVEKAGGKEAGDEAGSDTLPRKNVVPMLEAMGYDHDKTVMTAIVDRITQKEELDVDDWCLLLEEYHAPAYHYGQLLRKYCGRDELTKVQELLARGCDVNTGDGEGLTPLHYAAELNRVRVIQALAAAGGGAHRLRLDAQDKYGWAPLHSAAHQGNTDAVQALLKLGADASVVDKYGKTPLHYASAQVMCCVAQVLSSCIYSLEMHV